MCSGCGQRPREDGSCRNDECSQFAVRCDGRGAHWKIKRLQVALGGTPRGCFAATRLVGDYTQSGLAASLLHRHDVREGVASGMFLRERITDTSLRLEVLCLVFLCYRKWRGAASIVRLVISKLDRCRHPTTRAAPPCMSGAGSRRSGKCGPRKFPWFVIAASRPRSCCRGRRCERSAAGKRFSVRTTSWRTRLRGDPGARSSGS